MAMIGIQTKIINEKFRLIGSQRMQAIKHPARSDTIRTMTGKEKNTRFRPGVYSSYQKFIVENWSVPLVPGSVLVYIRAEEIAVQCGIRRSSSLLLRVGSVCRSSPVRRN